MLGRSHPHRLSLIVFCRSPANVPNQRRSPSLEHPSNTLVRPLHWDCYPLHPATSWTAIESPLILQLFSDLRLLAIIFCYSLTQNIRNSNLIHSLDRLRLGSPISSAAPPFQHSQHSLDRLPTSTPYPREIKRLVGIYPSLRG
jgi:hypothetical protein